LNGAVLNGVAVDGALYTAVGLPEHRIPLRAALTQAVAHAEPDGHGAGLAKLIALLRPVSEGAGIVWPVQLTVERAALLPIGDLERELARLILFADQAGLLAAMAAAAADQWSGVTALTMVADSIAYWETAFRMAG
jgi:hypothetical protein